MKLLRDAGVVAIQPGVESLSTHVLQLMRKGVTALQNIQLLKWCKQYGVTVAWNLLYGFPGETPADYADISRSMASLWHLPPPHAVGAIRMDRFSPYYNEAASFGLVNVRPMDMYRLLYPLPDERLRNLVYFFDFDHADGATPEGCLGDARRGVEQWRQAGNCSLTATRATATRARHHRHQAQRRARAHRHERHPARDLRAVRPASPRAGPAPGRRRALCD